MAWAKLTKERGAVARHIPSVAPGKNATDIALTIDAMEILPTHCIDTFVLIANDSDFAPLARRIREEGKDVIGYGSRSAAKPFRDACTSFEDIRSLTTLPSMSLPSDKLWSRQPIDAEAMMTTALAELGWKDRPVTVDALGKHLADRCPGFDPRIYSRRTLSDVLRALSSVELIQRDGRSHACHSAPGKLDWPRFHTGNWDWLTS